jgi:predicted O-methyltransferase YrrM
VGFNSQINNFSMISRVIRKLKFLSLESKIRAYNQFQKRKPFDQINSALIQQNTEILKKYYDMYVKEISSADMAASLELAVFMFTICKLNNYKKLLDLGSGLSSFVFRLYAKENSDVEVYSLDDDAAWLEKTKSFLQQHQLDVKNMYTLEQFLKLNEGAFDCILHDLNFVEVRINYIERIMKMVSQNGIVILDDVHKPDYLFALLTKLNTLHTKVYNVKPLTSDVYGRFSLAVFKE